MVIVEGEIAHGTEAVQEDELVVGILGQNRANRLHLNYNKKNIAY